MSTSAQKSGVSIGFPGLLAILFIGLKLTGYIAWSWLWILSPLWLPILSALAIIAVVFVVAGFIGAFR